MTLKFLINFLFFSSVFCTECGRSTTGDGLSIGGEYSEIGQWPWLAPLFLKEGDKFFCSANIISDRFLLTGEFLTNLTTNYDL